MTDLMLTIALRILLCLGAVMAVYQWLGNVAWAMCAPLFGVLLARPLIDCVAHVQYVLKGRALERFNGRLFVHKGKTFEILEDDEHVRWLRLSDVKKAIPGLPKREVLAQLHPGEVQAMGEPPQPCISAQALAKLLEKSSDPASLRFKVWLERAVAHPRHPGL